VCKPLVIENPRTTIQLIHTGSASGPLPAVRRQGLDVATARDDEKE